MWNLREQMGVTGKLQTWVMILFNRGKLMDARHRLGACGLCWPTDFFPPSSWFKSFQICCLSLKVRISSHKFQISGSLGVSD